VQSQRVKVMRPELVSVSLTAQMSFGDTAEIA
jgi:hypothetical protein